MRYEIKNGLVKESVLINAPYDTLQDAIEALIEYTKAQHPYIGPVNGNVEFDPYD